MAIFASDIQRTILQYYGEGSTIWQRMQTGEATEQEILRALGSAPQVQPVYSTGGYVLGYDWAEPMANDLTNIDFIVGSADSNSVGGAYASGNTFNTNIPANFGRDGSYIDLNSGATNTLGQTVATVADKLSLAVTGVNIGAKLGKAIDQTLYDLNPNWWDEHLPTINPETWSSLCGQSDIGDFFLRTLLGVTPEGTTAYIDEDVLAYYYMFMRDMGVWNTSGYEVIDIPESFNVHHPLIYTKDMNFTVTRSEGTYYVTDITLPTATGNVLTIGAKDNNDIAVSVSLSSTSYKSLKATTQNIGQPMNPTLYNINTGTFQETPTGFSWLPYTYDGKTVYYNVSQGNKPNFVFKDLQFQFNDTMNEVAWLIVYGESKSIGGVEGITDIDGATQYPPTNITGTTPDEVLQQLKQQYPDLFQNPITNTVMQPDGTLDTRTYIPIPWPNGINKDDTEPVTSDKTKEETQDRILIDDETLTLIFTDVNPEIDEGTGTPTGNVPPPTTGSGENEPIVLPVGQASSLWAIYNPTQGEVNSFGSWLWNSNFIEQLKKLFNDPMQAIIGIHKVFATPVTGGTSTIKCGYLDSNVSSKIVTSQYTDIDCGTVSLFEYFGNVFDYSPFTKVKLFLPFIGFVPLDTGDVMRGTINIKYTVDVITGACLATVTIMRDSAGGIIYSYGGSCIVTYPISSGSYTGVVAGALSLTAGIVGTVASGGSMLPTTLGTLSGIGKMHTDVQHSGSFSGSAGAMGCKIPYLVITRPQTRIAGNVGYYQGIPSNYTIKLSHCKGYTSVTSVHLNIQNAYYDELQEIESLLHSGVIF